MPSLITGAGLIWVADWGVKANSSVATRVAMWRDDLSVTRRQNCFVSMVEFPLRIRFLTKPCTQIWQTSWNLFVSNAVVITLYQMMTSVPRHLECQCRRVDWIRWHPFHTDKSLGGRVFYGITHRTIRWTPRTQLKISSISTTTISISVLFRACSSWQWSFRLQHWTHQASDLRRTANHMDEKLYQHDGL
jgi:hypothetical protein